METITDLDAQLANSRAFRLGYSAGPKQYDGITLYQSGLPDPQLNGVLRVAPGHLDPKAIAAVRRQLDATPWLWFAGPDSDPGLAPHLLACGAELVLTAPVMAVALDQVAPVEPVPGLVIREVTADDLGEWVQAWGPSFGIPAEQSGALTRLEEQRPDQNGGLVRFAGWLDGRIVASSVLLDQSGVAGVYVVTTAEGFRGRGIGAAMTGAALRAGRERGRRIGTLTATPPGEPTYLRMGFRTVAEYQIFTLPPAR